MKNPPNEYSKFISSIPSRLDEAKKVSDAILEYLESSEVAINCEILKRGEIPLPQENEDLKQKIEIINSMLKFSNAESGAILNLQSENVFDNQEGVRIKTIASLFGTEFFKNLCAIVNYLNQNYIVEAQYKETKKGLYPN